MNPLQSVDVRSRIRDGLFIASLASVAVLSHLSRDTRHLCHIFNETHSRQATSKQVYEAGVCFEAT